MRNDFVSVIYLAMKWFVMISSSAMDQQVCCVIGQDGDDLYGIACNNRAYMRKRGTQGAWYGIDKQVWQKAKAKNIEENLVTIDENDSHTGDPKDSKTIIAKNTYGGNCPKH